MTKHKKEQGGRVGSLHSTSQLSWIARCAYERSTKTIRDFDSVVCALFSVAFLNAFINDAILVARRIARPNAVLGADGEPVIQLPSVGEWATEKKLKLGPKYDLAKLVFTGHWYDKGVPPYSHCDLLVKTRNAIVHLEGIEAIHVLSSGKQDKQVVMYNHPKVIGGLRTAGLLVREEKDGFLDRINSNKFARWAFNTGVQMVQSFKDDVKNEFFKELLDFVANPEALKEIDG